MRDPADASRVREFMKRLGETAPGETRIYLTGGAMAVLMGWRQTTIDVDLKIVSGSDEIFRAIPARTGST